MNLPLRWFSGDTFAGSLYVGATDRHAIRANVAWYKNHESVGETISTLTGGDAMGPSGGIVDLGIAWVYYPERVLHGFMLEAGVLRRARDISTFDGDATVDEVDQDTSIYAVRGMLGWSWVMSRAFFIATGVGAQVGYETGTERTHSDRTRMVTSSHVSRPAVTPETYLRIGIVLDP